jgi:predicted metalloprotease with PDZ domain
MLVLSDAQGAVSVRADSGTRRWRALRSVTFPVSLVFKARMWPPGTRTNPSYMLRTADGAVSGQGTGILVTPLDGVDYAGRFQWDLSEPAPGSTTTSGLADVNDVRAPVSTLLQNFFMAGPLKRFPAAGERDGFAAYWHGTPPWDAPKVMAWVASLYEYMRTFWGETDARRYRVMGRMLPPPAYGGTALPGQFIFNAPAGARDKSDQGPLLLLAHETGHLFVRGLQNPGGGGPMNNWFTEGLNEYYAVTLALRSGLAPLDLVLGEMNLQTRNYYTNPRRGMPADAVARNNPMTDGMAQNISYERGMLFWADVDAAIRAASDGRRNLDSVMIPLVTRARTLGGEGDIGNQAKAGGQPGWFTPDELVDALVNAGGPGVRAEFDSVIVQGKRIVPRVTAFGPCFELRPTQLPDRYLGSAAARADTTRGAPAPLVDAYLWYRIPSVPDSRCRQW